MMKAAGFFEMSVREYQTTTRQHISEDGDNRHRQNLSSEKVVDYCVV
jgi:hypothetical protein